MQKKLELLNDILEHEVIKKFLKLILSNQKSYYWNWKLILGFEPRKRSWVNFTSKRFTNQGKFIFWKYFFKCINLCFYLKLQNLNKLRKIDKNNENKNIKF